jgi:D-alanyl-D-alanine dipeptidase
MTIDFTKEVHARKEELLKDLFSLLKIESVRDDEKATSAEPFGPGPAAALQKMLAIAKRDGFVTTNVDNYAGHFEYAQGEEVLGILVHMDVVPAGNGWKSNPFEPTIKNGKLYARGASDDKGPALAAYYGLKILKELNIPFTKKVRFIVGTDEESGWKDLDYYFKKAETYKPDFGFSPDAEFPIINGEKGNITEYLNFAGSNGDSFILHSFYGGVRENMVPETAQAVVTLAIDKNEFKEEFDNYIKKHQLYGELFVKEKQVTLKVIGKSAHGATPQLGVNAATYLANFLQQYDFQKDAANFLKVAGKYLLNDHYGEKLQVAYQDEKMGKLTMNAGVLRFEENGKTNKIALNFRYPQGTTPEKIKEKLTTTLEKLVQDIAISSIHPPHYVPVTDPLVATLLQVYEDHTGNKGFERIIGGGTYGRLLKRGVAYGAMFLHSVDTMHQANEFIALDDLFKACAIYADAIYRLTR